MKSSILALSIIIILHGCSSEDTYLETENPEITDNPVNNVANIQHNKWIYNQMSHHYFWYAEMPDSSSLDFTQKPPEFFETLKSPQDRFSWCEANYNYSKGGNENSTVSFDSIYNIAGKTLGYAVYDQFQTNADIRSLAVKFKNAKVEELILDLRYNPGGYVSTCTELASFILPSQHLGKLCQQQRYNDKLTMEKTKLHGGLGVDSIYFYSSDWYRKWGLDLSQLIILTTNRTASASESLIIGLRPYMKVVTIGTTSCGKDVGSYTIADNNYKYQLQPITFKYYNALNESTPTTGIVPDIYVEDDLEHQRGDTNEALLKAAIEYLTGETPHGAVKARSASQPKMQEVGRSSIEIKNNL